MNWKIAGAPGAWGVEDPANPNNPVYQRVLDDAKAAGYKGLELGPFGYMPLDIQVLEGELGSRDLTIVAGTIYDDLVSEENHEAVLEKTRKTCELISKLPKPDQVEGQRFETPYLVIIDSVKDERNPLAGHPDKAERLPKEDWDRMAAHIREISVLAKSYGVRGVVHPHAGGYIEFEDEIAMIMEDLNEEEVGLCLDTGHLYYSQMDPAEFLVKYSPRLDYVHFKDIQLDVYKKVIAENIGFFDGCNMGVMCPIGSGCVDYQAVKQALLEISYRGWITIEQERDPLTCDQSIEDARKSIGYLNAEGYDL